MDSAVIEIGLLFDYLLAALILWLGWRALTSQSLFRAIVLFVAFGLSMALAWVRLDAPDVALAEIAVSAGLTGALLLAAFGGVHRTGKNDERRGELAAHNQLYRMLLAVVTISIFFGLTFVILSLPPDAAGQFDGATEYTQQTSFGSAFTAVG